jgi:thiamine-phosphate pyrophosphorylase
VIPPLYAILDEETARRHGWSVAGLARAVLDGGARLLQVRVKTAGSADLLATARQVAAAARLVGARVIVNDRADVARLAGADGVHVGQDDLPAEKAAALLPPGALIGLSTHSREQVEAAAAQPVSYVAVGPVFATSTKEGSSAPVGLDLVRFAVERLARRPVVAIGGITLDRAPAVLAAGATSVAVISDLFAGRDPERRTRAYVEALSRGD